MFLALHCNKILPKNIFLLLVLFNRDTSDFRCNINQNTKKSIGVVSHLLIVIRFIYEVYKDTFYARLAADM